MYEHIEKPKAMKHQVTRSDIEDKINNCRRVGDDFLAYRASGLLQRRVEDKTDEKTTPAWQEPEPGLDSVSILALFPARAMLSGLYRGGASLFASGSFQVAKSLGSAATGISVRGGSHLLEGSKVTNIRKIADGRGIREVGRLVEQYGGKAKNWYRVQAMLMS